MTAGTPLPFLRNILCIRADNMGDILMSTPALRALKETFNCRITLLTSRMGQLITPFIDQIDETIVADVPWVKTKEPVDGTRLAALVQSLTERKFDAAVIFTVYSQNPLPAAMLAMMAGIETRVAYCRENPYQLLTHWIPDAEPYTFIQHQVERDLALAASLGAYPADRGLSVHCNEETRAKARRKLCEAGVDLQQPFLIFHPGVSEEKRKYPAALWTVCGRICLQKGIPQIIITGTATEAGEASEIQSGIGQGCVSAAGLFTVEELIAVIGLSRLVLSVNTGTIHIAAALRKPVVVLYALTNPQHTPWQTPSRMLYFSVTESLRSRNEVVRYVSDRIMPKDVDYPPAEDVWQAVEELLGETTIPGVAGISS